MDLDLTTVDGRSNTDCVLEDGMVAPVHLLYPGGEHERVWAEEVVAITVTAAARCSLGASRP